MVDDLMRQLMGDSEVFATDISGAEKETFFDEDGLAIKFVKHFCVIRVVDSNPYFVRCGFSEDRAISCQVLVVNCISKKRG